MNKVLITIITVIVIILIAAGLIYFTTTYNYPVSTSNNTYDQQNTQQNTQTEQTQQPKTSSISIKNYSFNPNSTTVSAGTTVIWTNNDPMAHQIKSDTFNSAVLNSGETFQFTFNIPGTYNYICSIHPSMKGKIIVTQQ